MSRYDMEEAGLLEPVGSKSPPMASQLAESLADLDPDEARPENNNSIITGTASYLDRLVYAIRLAVTEAPQDFPIHYWTETDYLAQLARVNVQERHTFGGGEGIDGARNIYEFQRTAFKEMEDVSYLIFDGLNCLSKDHYRFGEVRAVTDLLYRRMRDPLCFTFVVPTITALPDYYELPQFRVNVAPFYEFFDLR
jgi:hypothetical protein